MAIVPTDPASRKGKDEPTVNRTPGDEVSQALDVGGGEVLAGVHPPRPQAGKPSPPANPAAPKLQDASSRVPHSNDVTLVPFFGVVPDFIQADWHVSCPKPVAGADGRGPRGRQWVGYGLYWAIHQAVVAQRRAQVVVPDRLLAQIVWGGEEERWPRNWRQWLVKLLERQCSTTNPLLAHFAHRERNDSGAACPSVCALHGTAIRHQHFEITICSVEDEYAVNATEDDSFDHCFLGALEVFGHGDGAERAYQWKTPARLPSAEVAEVPEDPEEQEDRKAHEQYVKQVKGLRGQGRLTSVYLPLRLFGPSPRIGLSFRQLALHNAITHELTRVGWRRKSDRPDRAELLIGGVLAGGNSAAPCSFLQPGRRYVGFNGNGRRGRERLRGQGYRLLGDYGWLARAAYDQPEDKKGQWAEVRRFLKDLGALAEPFGLVVAAWHARRGEWLRLTDLLGLVRSESGRAWLGRCVLRVYTAEDYLPRWRQFFAERMGFSVIPEREQDRPAVRGDVTSPAGVREFLRRSGISQTVLARELGVSPSLLCQRLSGKRPWTKALQDQIAAWMSRRKG